MPTFDYGNNIRQMAKEEGVENAFAFPGFVPAYIRPLFCRGIGPFRWAALSGDPEDIYKTDAKVRELTPDNKHLHNWLDMARKRISFQGLPARICWVGLGDRHRLGLAFNEMVSEGRAEGAGRHRPRPSRFRLGRLAEPRNRSHEGRLGRRFRLAAAQRAAQHRVRRHLGVAAPWRRRRHGLLAAFRHGHLADGTEDAAKPLEPRAVERPGDRRHAPCRCRLRHRDRMRAGAPAQPAGHSGVSGFAIIRAGQHRVHALEERRRRDGGDRRVATRRGAGRTSTGALSMARVETDGPFSAFPGIDRTLAILEGEGIRLAVGRRTRRLR